MEDLKKEGTMSLGLNRADIMGRLGSDVEIRLMQSGERVANMSVATDDSYTKKETGERVERVDWHRVVTFEQGLIDVLEKYAKKGRMIYVSGTLKTRRYRKGGEDTDRFSTEIHVNRTGRVLFPAGVGEAEGEGAADAAGATEAAPAAAPAPAAEGEAPPASAPVEDAAPAAPAAADGGGVPAGAGDPA